MSEITKTIGCCVALGMSLWANTAWSQLYTAPTSQSITDRFKPTSIDQRINQQKMMLNSAGYGGMRSPQNSSLPSMQSGQRLNLGANTATRSNKPFSAYNAAPTVSPYLNLFRTDLNSGGNFNYSTLVQPQVQQQQVNQQLERAAIQNNRRLQSIAAQADFNPQGSKDEAPTGHQTVFGYMGHYYQQPQARQKKR